MTATDTILHVWFEQVWNLGQEDAIDRLMAKDAIVHDAGPEAVIGPEAVVGPDAFKPFFRKIRAAFPDIRIMVEQVVAEGDLIVARCAVTGTHTGDGVIDPPTRKEVRFTGMCMARVKDGLLVEGWNNFDFLSMYQQLGLTLA